MLRWPSKPFRKTRPSAGFSSFMTPTCWSIAGSRMETHRPPIPSQYLANGPYLKQNNHLSAHRFEEAFTKNLPSCRQPFARARKSASSCLFSFKGLTCHVSMSRRTPGHRRLSFPSHCL